MAQFLLLSVLPVPFLLALLAARRPSQRRGLRLLVVSTWVFHTSYVLALIFVYLRLR